MLLGIEHVTARLQEYFHYLTIEATIFNHIAQDTERQRQLHGFFVGTVIGEQGFINIGDSNNSGLNRHFLSGNLIWIALAIEVFVMGASVEWQPFLFTGKGKSHQPTPGVICMIIDDFSLGIAESASFNKKQVSFLFTE